MVNIPYVSFEGPIGAGKTTLATLLSQQLSAKLLLENVEGNAFLEDFYADRTRWALPMQQWFLVTRWRQLSEVPLSRTTPIVSDYSSVKDRVFARLLLSGRELELYDLLAGGLATLSASPDVIVYIDAKNAVLLERIHLRNRSYEHEITGEYLSSVRGAYETYFRDHKGLRLLFRDTSALDLNDDAQLSAFFDEILNAAASP